MVGMNSDISLAVTNIVDLSRLPKIYFYTSNELKYIQAKLVFAAAGLPLYYFPLHSEPYRERYDGTTVDLLRDAINEVAAIVGQRLIFFVEDTSLRIDALSDQADFPGMAVKDWFARTRFEELDHELRKIRRGRAATVKSDIALYLPGHRGPLFFHGETSGTVADTLPHFPINRAFPWLTPHSFNGWFIPQGHKKRLGEMSLEESWGVDFRVRSFLSLIGRLEEYARVLNLSPSAYISARGAGFGNQMFLFPQQQRVFALIGKSCSGKTSVASHLAINHGFVYYEASSVVRVAKELSGHHSGDLQEFSRIFHNIAGTDAVAKTLVQSLGEPTADDSIVIAGIRHLEELQTLLERYPSTQIIYVDATERTRFQRQLARGRPDDARKLSEIKLKDQADDRFTALTFGRRFADVIIANEDTPEDLVKRVDYVVHASSGPKPRGLRRRRNPSKWSGVGQEALRALGVTGNPMTADELHRTLNNRGHRVRLDRLTKLVRSLRPLIKEETTNASSMTFTVTAAGLAFLAISRGR